MVKICDTKPGPTLCLGLSEIVQELLDNSWCSLTSSTVCGFVHQSART